MRGVPASYAGRTERVAMYCHNTSCKRLNVEQEFRWSGATWDDPGEWAEEPACRACGRECHESEYEVEDAARIRAALGGEDA